MGIPHKAVIIKWTSGYKRAWKNIEGKEEPSDQGLTLGPGLASRVDVVPAVDVSLTMLDGLWFLSCFDMCRCGLQGGAGESSEYVPSCRVGSPVYDLSQARAGCLASEQLRSHFFGGRLLPDCRQRPQNPPVPVLQGTKRWQMDTPAQPDIPEKGAHRIPCLWS